MITATHSEVHSASGEGYETLPTHMPFWAPHQPVSTSGLAGCASNLRMQMLTIEDLLRGIEAKMPPKCGTRKEMGTHWRGGLPPIAGLDQR